MPTGETSTIPGRRGTSPEDPEDATVFEVALATRSPRRWGSASGTPGALSRHQDALVGQFGCPVGAAADVVGIYAVADPADEFWMNDSSLELPTVIVVSPDSSCSTARRSSRPMPIPASSATDSRSLCMAVLPRCGPARCRDGRPAHFRPARDADPLPAVRDDAARRGRDDPPDGPARASRRLRGRAAHRRGGARDRIARPVGGGTAAVALVALLIVHRRRGAVMLVRGRGASVASWSVPTCWRGCSSPCPAARCLPRRGRWWKGGRRRRARCWQVSSRAATMLVLS